MPNHISREEIAKAEIGRTDSTPGVNWFLSAFFLVVIMSVPLLQTVREFSAIHTGRERARSVPQSWDVFTFLRPTRLELKSIAGAGSLGGVFAAGKAVNNRILRDIVAYEAALKDRDSAIQWLIPRMQKAITGWLKGGNEDVYCGRNGWLFYRRDLDSLTGRAFLRADVLKQRAAAGSEIKAPPQPDPVKAILDFRDQLARRGIALIVMPVPVKPSICPEHHSARYSDRSQPVQNPAFPAFEQRMAEAGVALLDAAPLLAQAKARTPDAPLYLQTDTHWTPQAMEMTARALADFVRERLPPSAASATPATSTEGRISNVGDVAAMLRLPAGQTFYPPQTVTVRQVTDGARLWRPTPTADVLFLGDSFANIFSLDTMGWGEAAGLVEHLSLALGRPLDAIRRNDAGAWATRGMLAAELKRGHDRLAGKKLVIWEFAARELSLGDWKLIPLELGREQPAAFYGPPGGESIVVSGIVAASAAAPRPGAVPYRDHIVMVHLTDLAGAAAPPHSEAVVLMWSMRNNVWTHAARYRPGDRIAVRLRPWTEMPEALDAVNRTELDDDALLLADPCWGEEVEEP